MEERLPSVRLHGVTTHKITTENVSMVSGIAVEPSLCLCFYAINTVVCMKPP
jgi:hypothetical protein